MMGLWDKILGKRKAGIKILGERTPSKIRIIENQNSREANDRKKIIVNSLIEVKMNMMDIGKRTSEKFSIKARESTEHLIATIESKDAADVLSNGIEYFEAYIEPIEENIEKLQKYLESARGSLKDYNHMRKKLDRSIDLLQMIRGVVIGHKNK